MAEMKYADNAGNDKPASQLHRSDNKSETFETEVRFAAMLYDANIDRLMALNTNLEIMIWNKANEIVTGIPRDKVIGKHFFTMFPECASHTATVEALQRTLEGHSVFVPADTQSPDGIFYENHYMPLKGEQGKVIGLLNIKHEVAHRIKAENELKALNKALARKNRELKQKNEELTIFTDVVVHELKGPLRKIYGFIEMIATQENNSLTEKAKGLFKKVQAGVQRMGILTDDLLVLSDLDKKVRYKGKVDLENALESAKAMLEEDIQVAGAVIRRDTLPTVTGYRTLLTQLFYRLLDNAIKFRNPDQQPVITITSNIVSGSDIKQPDVIANASFVKISISDNGIGFSNMEREKIFKMFYKVNRSAPYPGTGIGLSLCYKIASIHHGIITADSIEGEGTTVTLFLPL